MTIIKHQTLEGFALRTRDWLLERECENCFQLGVLGGARPRSQDALLWTIEADGQIHGVALQTDPFAISITRMPPHSVDALAEELIRINWQPSGVAGPVQPADALAARVAEAIGRPARMHLRLRVFQLTRVLPPRPAPGRLIPAPPPQLDLLAEWIDWFNREITEPHPDPLGHTKMLLEANRLFAWEENGRLRAIAAIAGPTPNGIRINHVYTPPESRNRGYASNLVAALSQRMLDSGRKFCFLFTDQANPTSNKIYQGIGYAPVSDFHHWRFD